MEVTIEQIEKAYTLTTEIKEKWQIYSAQQNGSKKG